MPAIADVPLQHHLFVYGSLTTALGHPMGDRLRREAQLLGPARVAGRLHRVSWYPGVRPAEMPSDKVYGELYRFGDAPSTLVWLDEYEGVVPGGTSAAASDEYERCEREVALFDGTTFFATIYLYQRALPLSSWIADGIWRG